MIGTLLRKPGQSRRILAAIAATFVLATMLSGCIIVEERPHHWHYWR